MTTLDITSRQRLLAAAGEVFAEKGLKGGTVREICTRAEANLAAVNYYFRSKEELYEEIVKRRQMPLTDERLRRLDECLLRAGEKRPLVKNILRALVEPSLQLCFDHPYFARLSSRLRFDKDTSLWSEYLAHQSTMMRRYQDALCAALPGLPTDEVYRRLVYVLADLAGEDFHEDQIPYLRGNDRQAVSRVSFRQFPSHRLPTGAIALSLKLPPTAAATPVPVCCPMSAFISRHAPERLYSRSAICKLHMVITE